jgi:hypothetical protein
MDINKCYSGTVHPAGNYHQSLYILNRCFASVAPSGERPGRGDPLFIQSDEGVIKYHFIVLAIQFVFHKEHLFAYNTYKYSVDCTGRDLA